MEGTTLLELPRYPCLNYLRADWDMPGSPSALTQPWMYSESVWCSPFSRCCSCLCTSYTKWCVGGITCPYSLGEEMPSPWFMGTMQSRCQCSRNQAQRTGQGFQHARRKCSYSHNHVHIGGGIFHPTQSINLCFFLFIAAIQVQPGQPPSSQHSGLFHQ